MKTRQPRWGRLRAMAPAVTLWAALAVALPATMSAPAGAQPAPGAHAYVLGPLDVLEISVWGHPDLTRVVAVRPDGKISLPIVGDVQAAGLSVARLMSTIAQAYAQYIKNPQVTVIVREFRRISASVLGQIARPGTYQLHPEATLLDLLSASGGPTEVASRSAQLLRPQQPPVTVDLDRVLAGDQEANLVLRGGETLVVSEDLVNIVNIMGQVARPGRYRIKGDLRVMDALLLAGGLTEKASLTEARLVRGRDTRPLHLDALLLRQEMAHNTPLQAGDVLFIPEEINNIIYILGDVNRPGAFPVKDEPTLLQVLAMAGGPVQRGVATAKTVNIVRRGGSNTERLLAQAGKVESLPNGGLLVTVEMRALMEPAGPARTLTVKPGDVVVVPQSGLSGFQSILSILSGIVGVFR